MRHVKSFLIVFIVGVAFLLVACQKEQPAGEAAEAVVGDKEAAEPAQDVMEKSYSADELASIDPLTEGSCTRDNAEVTFTNNLATELELADVVFRINGAIDASPGCDKTTLASGESTRCATLDQVKTPGTTAFVQAWVGDDKYVLKMKCSG